MSMSLFEKLIDDIKVFPDRIKAIRLYYLGEPFLNPNFPDMLMLLAESDVCDRIEVTTNGSVITDQLIDKLIDAARVFAGVIYIRFSIYSVYSDHFLQITGNKSFTPEMIKGNVRMLYKKVEEVENISVYAKKLKTLTDEDQVFLQEYQSITDDVQLEDPMNWSGDGGKEDFLLKGEYSKDTLKQILKSDGIYPRVCSYPFTTLSVMADGEVVVCCKDWTRKTRVGNISDKSLYEIWNGEKLRSIRKTHLKGRRDLIDSCRNCKRMPLDKTDYLDPYADDLLKRLGL